MAKFWSFLDESGSDDKRSGKRVNGTWILLAAGLGFLASGFKFYNLDNTEFIAMLSTGGALLGIGVVKNILAKKDK